MWAGNPGLVTHSGPTLTEIGILHPVGGPPPVLRERQLQHQVGQFAHQAQPLGQRREQHG